MRPVCFVHSQSVRFTSNCVTICASKFDLADFVPLVSVLVLALVAFETRMRGPKRFPQSDLGWITRAKLERSDAAPDSGEHLKSGHGRCMHCNNICVWSARAFCTASTALPRYREAADRN